MMLVSQPDEFADFPERQRQAARHFMIVSTMTIRSTNSLIGWLSSSPGGWVLRQPARPRCRGERIQRAVTTFVLTLVDLKNGMDFKVGKFIRRGHDYRIDTCESVQIAYALSCSPEQATAMETRLRARESEWATRRLVARKFANARDSVTRQLTSWGVSVPEPAGPGHLGIPEVADIDPTKSIIQTLGSSGVS